MERPVAAARELLNGEWRHAWPAPLVRWLRERSLALPLDWVLRCVRELLPRTDTPHCTELLADLDQLERWRSAPPASGVFHDKTEELWYRPDRDNAQLAVCRLHSHLACAVCPDLKIEPNWLWPVVSLLCGHDRPRADLVAWCIGDFESFVGEVLAK